LIYRKCPRTTFDYLLQSVSWEMRIGATTFLFLVTRFNSLMECASRQSQQTGINYSNPSLWGVRRDKATRPRFCQRKSKIMERSDEGSALDSAVLGLEHESRNRVTPAPRKHHTLTVCMVPHPSQVEAWQNITEARMQMKDPGLFRWPPHVNLLYPFIDIKPKDDCSQSNSLSIRDDIVDRLRAATNKCEPFYVTLDKLGCFGGVKRGVLWFYPTSRRDECTSHVEPLIELQSLLQEQFPECDDQKKNGVFTPHMTISHFPNLDESTQAQREIEQWWPTDLTFRVGEIYLLERKGDDDQFLRVASIRLGMFSEMGESIILHSPPEAFPAMPSEEEDWIRRERMIMKDRRRNNGSFNKGRRRKGTIESSNNGDKRGRSQSKDTPEEIEAKRLARKAKREAREQGASAATTSSGDIDHSD